MKADCRKFELISAGDLDKYIGAKDYIIVDLRDAKDFKQKHITSSVNIPYRLFQNKIDEYFDKGKVYILYCERGGTSILAARQLSCLGYEVKTVTGGIKSYRGKMTESNC